MPGRVISSTTQEFLDIYDITNNVVIMKDGSVSAILNVNAMNFSLLAEEEQDAVIYAYAALLNSLNYPIQINIQSKTKDATKYLDLLRQQQEKASTKDKADRIGRYQQFVSKLIQERNVLDKKFYVIIPATPVEMGIMPPQSMMPSLSGKNQFDISTIERSIILEKALGVLDPRVTHLIGQFTRIGLHARQLNTQEIIQIYYTNYNPEAAEGQQLVESSDYAMPLVRASVFNTSLKDLAQAVVPPAAALQATTQSIDQPAAAVDQVTSPDVAYVAANETAVSSQTTQPDAGTATEATTPFAAVATTPATVDMQIDVTQPSIDQDNSSNQTITPTVDTAAPEQPVQAPVSADPANPNYTLPPVAEIT